MSIEAIRHLPIMTTILSAVFSIVLIRAAMIRKSGPHLWWWAAGVICYGLGTIIESSITLYGNTVLLTKLWYIFGALLGGYPLAQGAVWLHLKPKKALVTNWLTIPLIVIGSILVVMSPANLAVLEATRPTSAVIAWRWIGLFPMVINTYALIFLVGGAVFSSIHFAKTKTHPERILGNVLIAIGGLLPGVGGAYAKFGHTEVLYVMELIGLILIWAGYGVIAVKKHAVESNSTGHTTFESPA